MFYTALHHTRSWANSFTLLQLFVRISFAVRSIHASPSALPRFPSHVSSKISCARRPCFTICSIIQSHSFLYGAQYSPISRTHCLDTSSFLLVALSTPCYIITTHEYFYLPVFFFACSYISSHPHM